ncbi:MAG: hypothetical protein GXO00_01620 [Candidatus Diapherotrites archaeon]|nr:hypothetical protein [Candidatus Diapherotrites archaeon]
MGGGVPVDRRVIVALLLWLTLLPAALASECRVISTPEEVFNIIVSAVYDANGYFPFSGIQTLPTDVKPVERNELILVDPSTGTAYDVGVSDSAVRPSESLFGNVYAEGPFAVSVILDNTLRFAYPDGYGDGPYLRERFEGRYEFGFSQEAFETIVTQTLFMTTESFLPFLKLEELLREREPIKNRILGNDFAVTEVCASDACRKEIYSLLTKYMNLGATAEMVFEFGASVGGGVFLGKIREGLTTLGKVSPTAEKVSKELTGFLDALKGLKGSFYEGARVAYDGLSNAEKDVIKQMLKNPAEADKLIKNLPPRSRRIVATFYKEIGDIADDIVGTFKDNMKVVDVKELENVLERLKFYSSIVDEGPIVEAKNLLESVKNVCKGKDVCAVEGTDLKITIGKSQIGLREAIEMAKSKLLDVAAAYDRVAPHTPLLTTQYDAVSYAINRTLGIEEKMGKPATAVLTKYIVTPIAFYTARAGPYFLGAPTFPGAGTSSPLHLFPIQQAYELPASWKTFEIVPLEDRDAVVDVLINNGSDPGDIFKSVLGVTGTGALNRFIEKFTGTPALDPFVISKEDERVYQMKEAIVTVAVEDRCPNCSFARSPEGISFTTGSLTYVAVTENSPPEEGSTLITFFRKANLYANGEKVIDVTDRENACSTKCPLLKGMFLLGDDPAVGMYRVSLFIGVVLPSLTGIGALTTTMLTYPIVSMLVYEDCFSCVDDVFGYYLHLRALPTEAVTPEENLTATVISSLEALGIDVNGVQILSDLQRSRIEKKQVMLYATFPAAKGTLFGDVAAEWARTERSLPVAEREAPLRLVGENNVTLDGFTIEGGGKVASAETIPYAVPDTRIPGIIIPAKLVEIFPGEETILVARFPDDYQLGESVKKCVDVEKLGKLKAVITTLGSISFDENGPFVQTENWSGYGAEVRVEFGFKVFVKDADIIFEENGVRMELTDIEVGELKAIVFENASIIRKGIYLYYWQKELEAVPKEAVEGVILSSDGETFSLEIVPSPDATVQERQAIEAINELLKEATVLESSRYAVAIVRGEDGKLYLRIYDKERNEVVNEEILDIYQDPNDPTALLVKTVDENGETQLHSIKVEVTADGTPVLKIDGESGGVLTTVQTPNGFLYFDPETGEWKLINGVLAPLAEAFKNGIKMTFEGGVGIGTPSGNIVINTGGTQTGFNLPLFEGWEIILVVFAAALMFLTI